MLDAITRKSLEELNPGAVFDVVTDEKAGKSYVPRMVSVSGRILSVDERDGFFVFTVKNK